MSEAYEEATGARFERLAPEYEAAFARFIRRYYSVNVQQLHQRLCHVSTSSSTRNKASALTYSLHVCAQRVLDFNAQLGTLLFVHPEQLLPLFHCALAQEVSCNAGEPSSGLLPLKARRKLKVRVTNLPPVPPLRKSAISTIRSTDVKRLIQIAGTVVRTGMIKMQETEREYQCCNVRCGHRFLVTSDPEQGNILEIPKICPVASRGGTSKKPCTSSQFLPIDGGVVSDHQVIKIQEQASKLGVGSIPRSISVVLEDDLVDSVKAGDHVIVVGKLMRTWAPCVPGVRCDLETTIKANSIRIKNATTLQALVTEEQRAAFIQFWTKHKHDVIRGRNEIVASVCPKIYGLFIVKLAVALTMIGGVSYVDASGMKTRGEPHLLLIGDPGTGKSQFLRFTAELSPRSVLTTGIGTTRAGLTCTAVKDGGEWMLEAGALVLADRGVCCIDEFRSIRSTDRTALHEAMEQQTISVAKAGLVCKLNARTTIFAVTNPNGRYDPTTDVSGNTSIASPLLSRFDLILVLLDRRHARWDHVVSSFILKQAAGTATSMKQEVDGDETRHSSDTQERRPSTEEPAQWSVQKLQAYICYVKDTYAPQLSRGAMVILQRYYQKQRASDSRSPVRTTIRLLESLTRLAQAHARLMCHSEAAVMDAVVAVFVMDVSKATANGSDLLGGSVESVLHSTFSPDPVEEYALQEKLVLDYLMLSELRTAVDSGTSDPFMEVNASNAKEISTLTGKRARTGHQLPVDSNAVGDQRVEECMLPSQPQISLLPSLAVEKVDEEDKDIMDDYRRGLQDSQDLEAQTRAAPRPRFDFGRWSQQARASQSIIQKWK